MLRKSTNWLAALAESILPRLSTLTEVNKNESTSQIKEALLKWNNMPLSAKITYFLEVVENIMHKKSRELGLNERNVQTQLSEADLDFTHVRLVSLAISELLSSGFTQ